MFTCMFTPRSEKRDMWHYSAVSVFLHQKGVSASLLPESKHKCYYFHSRSENLLLLCHVLKRLCIYVSLFNSSNILIRLDNISITLLTCAQTRVFVKIHLCGCLCTCMHVCLSGYLWLNSAPVQIWIHLTVTNWLPTVDTSENKTVKQECCCYATGMLRLALPTSWNVHKSNCKSILNCRSGKLPQPVPPSCAFTTSVCDKISGYELDKMIINNLISISTGVSGVLHNLDPVS